MNSWGDAAKKAFIRSLFFAIPVSLLGSWALLVWLAEGLNPIAGLVASYGLGVVVFFLPILVFYSPLRTGLKTFAFLGSFIGAYLMLVVYLFILSSFLGLSH